MSAALPIFKHLTHTVISNDATASLSLSDNPLYMIQAKKIVPETDNTPIHVTYNALTANYAGHRGQSDSDSALYSSAAASGQTNARLVNLCGNGTGESFSYQLFIPNAASSTLFKPCWGIGTQVDHSGFGRFPNLASYYSGATTAFTSATFAFDSDNLATGIVDKFGLALYEAGDVGETYGSATLISRTVISDDATVDITLSGDHLRWIVVCLGVVCETDNVTMYGRVGTSGGVQSSSCKRHHNLSASGSSSYIGAASGNSGILNFCQSTGNAAGENFCQVISIPNPASQYKVIGFQGAYMQNTGAAKMANGAGAWTGGTDQLTTYRILTSADNVDIGTVLLYGITG